MTWHCVEIKEYGFKMQVKYFEMLEDVFQSRKYTYNRPIKYHSLLLACTSLAKRLISAGNDGVLDIPMCPRPSCSHSTISMLVFPASLSSFTSNLVGAMGQTGSTTAWKTRTGTSGMEARCFGVSKARWISSMNCSRLKI